MPIIPKRKGEHPVEATEGVVTPLLIGVDDDLRVTVGRKVVAVLLQLSGQLTEVVVSPVERTLTRPFFMGVRLGSPRHINNGEAPDAHGARSDQVHTLLVRPAMYDPRA